MKIFKLSGFILLLIPLITLSQNVVSGYQPSFVSVDPGLINNSEVWQIKTGISTAWKLPKTEFGSFKTIEAEKGEKTKISSKKQSELSGSGGGKFGIVKEKTTVSERSYTMTILYNDTDQIGIDMRMLVVTENKHETIQLGKNAQPDENYSATYWDETYIKINKNTTAWHMSELNSLINAAKSDSFEIQHVNGFTIGKKGKPDLLKISTGRVFLHDGLQVAAIEVYPVIKVWMRNNLKEEYRQVLGGAIISIIAAYTTSVVMP
jgi:hypothetical protein